MPPIQGAHQVYNVGVPVAIRSKSPASQFALVFEDDGEAGNVYALDLSKESAPLLDTLNVYLVDEISDPDIPCEGRIIWSTDGLKAMFGINLYPHVVVDFEHRRAFCRRPDRTIPNRAWTSVGHEWMEEALSFFKDEPSA